MSGNIVRQQTKHKSKTDNTKKNERHDNSKDNMITTCLLDYKDHNRMITIT